MPFLSICVFACLLPFLLVRLRMSLPHGHSKTTTLVAGLRSTGMVAPLETDGPFTSDGGIPFMPWDVEAALPIWADAWSCSISEVDRSIRLNLRKLVSTLDQLHAE